MIKKNFTASIRIHLVIMIVLYGGTWFIANNFVMKQQQETIKQYRDLKAKLEYDYLRIKNYPDYVKAIQSTLNTARKKVEKFVWLNSGYDPNLLFFQHMSALAEKTRAQILNLQPVERNNERYYIWNVSLRGAFLNIKNLIKEIESSEKFLKLESIEIATTEDEIEINLRISGIKKLE
ncbi:MAG: hypothetical protein NC931_06865 [Candidatus Omnitrophica bacterium]|nr:hypothetical protein [Candidatus Omnitrophota bacterium]